MRSNMLLMAILVVVVGVGSFFGGMKYQQSKTPAFTRQIPEGMRGQFGQRTGNTGLNAVRGTIIGVDENSITVKLPDESSKIVILTDSTGINKSEEGSKEDLTEGTEVSVFGQTNADGSLTAQNIQIGTGMFQRPQ